MREPLDDWNPGEPNWDPGEVRIWEEGAPFKWFLRIATWATVVLLLLVLWSLSGPARAQQVDGHFTTGEALRHGLSVCLDLDSAKQIVLADHAEGLEAGMKAWIELDTCQNVTIEGLLVGKVVFSETVKRETGLVKLKVVEIKNPGSPEVLAYFLTTREVRAMPGARKG